MVEVGCTVRPGYQGTQGSTLTVIEMPSPRCSTALPRAVLAASMADEEPKTSTTEDEALARAEARIVRPIPKTEALIKASGLSEREKRQWLAYLRTSDLSDDELHATLVEEPAMQALERRPKAKSLWRRARILGYEIERLWKQQNSVINLLYAGAWVYLLAVPVAKVGLTLGSIISVIYIVSVKGSSFFTELRPKHMKKLAQTYDERKLRFAKLIETTQLWHTTPPTNRERFEFQHDALQLILMYVRDHRYDGRKKIFVNLMIAHDHKVWVINRADLTSRQVPKEYTPDQCALAWEAIKTGQAQITGDVYEDFPASVPGKKYVSVLALPIRIGTRVVGAVSIDSEGKHHFDGYFEELQTGLAPYVQLLALAMFEDHADNALPTRATDADH